MARKAIGTIIALMAALVAVFTGTTWDVWKVVLRAIFALPLTDSELAVYRALTDRVSAPLTPFREVWLIVGRRGGKSVIAALIVVYQCTCRTFKRVAGELLVFMVIAADRRQARVIKSYVAGMLRALHALESLVETETADTITLKNGIRIEITTASFRTLRGYTVIGAVCDEVAFWQSEDSANPDAEILAALRPAMATQPDALLVCITSPYARRGEVWRAVQAHYGKDTSPVLVVNADSRTMNPALPQEIVDRAFQDDPAHAAAEYGSAGKVEFRSDIESFVTPEAVALCTMDGRLELPYRRGVDYKSFTDPAGGSGRDWYVTVVGHVERGRIVIDAIRAQAPSFSPDETTKEHAALLKQYRISYVRGDRWAGEWPRERWRKHGISYRVEDKTKSEMYQGLLPRLNAGTIELLDHERANKQLLALERRTSRGGRDSIDHPPGTNDDIANAIAGVAHALREGQQAVATWGLEDHEQKMRDEIARCAEADAERIAAGTQDEYLTRQSRGLDVADWLDRNYGMPGAGTFARRPGRKGDDGFPRTAFLLGRPKRPGRFP